MLSMFWKTLQGIKSRTFLHAQRVLSHQFRLPSCRNKPFVYRRLSEMQAKYPRMVDFVDYESTNTKIPIVLQIWPDWNQTKPSVLIWSQSICYHPKLPTILICCWILTAPLIPMVRTYRKMDHRVSFCWYSPEWFKHKLSKILVSGKSRKCETSSAVWFSSILPGVPADNLWHTNVPTPLSSSSTVSRYSVRFLLKPFMVSKPFMVAKQVRVK